MLIGVETRLGRFLFPHAGHLDGAIVAVSSWAELDWLKKFTQLGRAASPLNVNKTSAAADGPRHASTRNRMHAWCCRGPRRMARWNPQHFTLDYVGCVVGRGGPDLLGARKQDPIRIMTS